MNFKLLFLICISLCLPLIFFGLKELDIAISLFFFRDGSWLGQDNLWQYLFYKFGRLPGLILPVIALYMGWQQKKKRPIAGLIVFSFLLGPGLLVNGVFKIYNDRPRPRACIEFYGEQSYALPLQNWRKSPEHQSFPSGHAAIAFFLLTAEQLFAKRLRPIWISFCLSFGLLMGLARISVGAHYYSDIVGALFLSLLPYTIGKFLVSRETSLET